MPGGTRGLELLIPFLIGGLILHGFLWLLAKILPIEYVGLSSNAGLLVWLGGGYTSVLLYLLEKDGWRETIIPFVKWSIVVGAVYAVAAPVGWYLNAHPDAQLVTWFLDTGKAAFTTFNNLPGGIKMVIAVFGFLFYLIFLPLGCYLLWTGIKTVFRKLVRPTEPKPPGRASS